MGFCVWYPWTKINLLFHIAVSRICNKHRHTHLLIIHSCSCLCFCRPIATQKHSSKKQKKEYFYSSKDKHEVLKQIFNDHCQYCDEYRAIIDKLINVSEKPKIETIFEDFRKKYCGTKRGFEIEFNLFKKTCKAYKLKPSEEVVKLLPAFLGEDELRMKTWRSNKFFPERAFTLF